MWTVLVNQWVSVTVEGSGITVEGSGVTVMTTVVEDSELEDVIGVTVCMLVAVTVVTAPSRSPGGEQSTVAHGGGTASVGLASSVTEVGRAWRSSTGGLPGRVGFATSSWSLTLVGRSWGSSIPGLG